ncbi:putative OB-fold protein [Marisediminicola sp. UYEF4]|uniref:Zn-ribbon domain-containing OB-fold protein n=1 Tax=Marisediminicola sp. UYEF4 TaxID=1756384 RepID=UPI00339A7D9B
MTDTAPARPTAILRGEEQVFYAHARQREVVFQRCGDCARAVFYLRTICPECGSENLSIERSSGLGRVYSFTTQHRAAHPFFQHDVPYTLVLADMEEGFRLFANIVDCDPEQVHVGLAVETVFDDVTDELTLPRFRPRSRLGETTA